MENSREIRVRPLTAEIRADENGNETIEGYVVKFDKLSVPLWGFREKIRKGAFTRTLREHRDRIKALWNHNTDMVIGSTKSGSLELEEDDTGLRFRLAPNKTRAAQDALETIRSGDVDGVSFSFDVRKQEWDETDESNVIRTIIDLDLYEISPTPFPAYPDSSAAVRTAEKAFEQHKAERAKAEAEAAGRRFIDIQSRKLKLMEMEE